MPVIHPCERNESVIPSSGLIGVYTLCRYSHSGRRESRRRRGEFDYSRVDAGVVDDDDERDEREASSRMPVFPGASSSALRNRLTDILTVRRPASSASRCVHPCRRRRPPSYSLVARARLCDIARYPRRREKSVASDTPLKRAPFTRRR